MAFAVIVGVLIPRTDDDVTPNGVLASSGEAQGDGDAGGLNGTISNDLELEAAESTKRGGGTSQLSSISRLTIASLSFLLLLFFFPFSFSEKELLLPFTYL
jgi:ABC-type Na+ efflux pump permease subunit